MIVFEKLLYCYKMLKRSARRNAIVMFGNYKIFENQ
jgi:hypothetical protein